VVIFTGLFVKPFKPKNTTVMEFVCPKPTALTTVTKVTCPENLGQIQRVIFQRAGWEFDANADPVTTITLLASWTPLITAAGDTKIIITPNLVNFVIPQGEAQTQGGGDNSTTDGVEEVVGTGPITVTADLVGVPTRIISQLRKLMESETDLVAYFINQYGQIICRELDPIANPGDVYGGIPVYFPFIPHKGNAGLNTKDVSTMRFGLDEGWADNLAILKGSDFNAKTQLVSPA
jgi:hypothetical protein